VFTFLLLSLATFFYMCYSLVQQSTIHGFSFGMVVGGVFPFCVDYFSLCSQKRVLRVRFCSIEWFERETALHSSISCCPQLLAVPS
jgi:hypothetical protein